MSMGMMGRKIGMTQVYGEGGVMLPVTVVSVGPCQVLAIKNYNEKSSSLVIGYEERVKGLIKPVLGYFNKLGEKIGKKITPKRYIKEFKVIAPAFKEGDVIHADLFSEKEKVIVSGISKGKGTQGVVKRHKMHGGPASHGSHFHRKPGSIGAATFPARVWKGHKMGGHMGSRNVTVKNLLVCKVDVENNLLYLRGAVPGAKRGLVFIKKQVSVGK